MDDETRAAIAGLSETMHAGFAQLSATMHAGFARWDHYFELQQKQFIEWRAELREIAGLEARVERLEQQME